MASCRNSLNRSRYRIAAKNWSGQRNDSTSTHKYRWQGAGAGVRGPRGLSAKRRLRPGFYLLLAALLSMFALFVYCLVFSPAKTPLVIISATDYIWPVAPNAWAKEDIEGLTTLDGKTVNIIDTSSDWRSKRSGLTALDKNLREIAKRRANNGVVVFYVSMPGIVDENGMPCLLLPGGSPIKSADWLTLEEFFEHVTRELPESLRKLLIFDCGRQQTNWNIGLVRSTFAERLAELAEKQVPHNVTVINSTSAGEVAWSSPDIRGSVFGRAVREGLAGAADKPQRREEIKGGNSNGGVSVRELHRYVQREVGKWTQFNRGVPQTPQLIPANLPDYRISWSLNRGSLKSIMEADATTSRGADAIANEEISDLWQKMDAVRASQIQEHNPLAWRELEHRLLWLEQLSASGSAYKEPAIRVYQELRDRLALATERASKARDESSWIARSTIFEAHPLDFSATFRLHSIALGEFFGKFSRDKADATRSGFLAATTMSADEGSVAAGSEEFLEGQFLRLARGYDVQKLWKDGQIVREGWNARDRAERLAVVGDERAHYWLRTALDAADQKLRGVEDQLFVGSAESASEQWNTIRQLYDKIGGSDQALRPRIERALAIRDRAFAETPYLAQWLCRPDSSPIDDLATGDDSPTEQVKSEKPLGDAAGSNSDNPVNRQLVPFLLNTRKLGELIDNRSGTPPDGPPEFLDLAQNLEGDLQKLKSLFTDKVTELVSRDKVDGLTHRELQQTLAVPIVPATQRLTLQRKMVALGTKLQEAFTSKDEKGAQKKGTDEREGESDDANDAGKEEQTESNITAARVDYLGRLRGWTVHPLSLVLGMESDPVTGPPPNSDSDSDHRDDLAAIERLSQRIRLRLLELPTLPVTDKAMPAEVSQTRELVRANLSRTERALRLACPIWYGSPEVDPISQLRKFDIQQLLLWHCRRTLEDFWGTGPIAEGSVGERPPFFDVAVSDHLQVVEKLLTPSTAVEREIEDIRRLLNRRRFAAKRGLSVAVETGSAEESTESVLFEVSVKPGISPKAAGAAASDDVLLPPGNGVVFARAGSASLPGARAKVPVPISNDGERLGMASNVPVSMGSTFQAIAMFRGNEFAAPFMRPGLGGVIVEHAPKAYSTAQVTLFGDRPQQSSVLFILDCSASMGEDIPVELIDADRLPRLEIAKSALDSLLSQLAARNDTRVGVRFFGHRVGWAKSETAKLMMQTGYAGKIPEDLTPSEDVELVLPLGRFDSVEAGLVTQRLKSVRAWGQSPLYLSLLQSLNDFDADKVDADRSVVVITDGANYQFTPTGGGLTAPEHKTVNDVLGAWKNRNIPIYILGFGIDRQDAATAEREFKTLADQTQGKYLVVNNGRDLLRSLNERVGMESYQVESSAARPLVTRPRSSEPTTRLNTPIEISGITTTPVTYNVKFQSITKPVTLEGGEALELFASRASRDIISHPYDKRLPVQDFLVASGQIKRNAVRAHRPERNGSTVTFPVSVQEEDNYFTPRPSEIWIEITPMGKEASEELPTYIFYDRHFEPGTPVPVVDCTARNWPAQCSQARIHVWCKFTSTEAGEAIPLNEVSQNRAKFLTGQPVRVIEGVKYRVQISDPTDRTAPVEMKITEEHDKSSPGIQSLKVLLETDPSLRPTRIVRRFDAKNRLVVHSYWFTSDTARRVLDASSSRLTFTTRNATREGAWRIENGRPLTVDIFSSGDILPLEAATGAR